MGRLRGGEDDSKRKGRSGTRRNQPPHSRSRRRPCRARENVARGDRQKEIERLIATHGQTENPRPGGRPTHAPRFRGPSIVNERIRNDRHTNATQSFPSVLTPLPSRSPSLPSGGESLPSAGPSPSPRGETFPPGGEPLPPRGESLPPRGESLPSGGETFPSPGERLPFRGESLPSLGEPLPSRGE